VEDFGRFVLHLNENDIDNDNDNRLKLGMMVDC